MASGHTHHDSDEVAEEFPGEGEPIGGYDDLDGHGDHGHDDHGHDDHGHGAPDDKWVLLPVGIGLLIGIIIVAALGLGSGVAPF